ncbi:MAG: hypothetical protein WCG27_13385, partial [Pseudomonadota bacterium]
MIISLILWAGNLLAAPPRTTKLLAHYFFTNGLEARHLLAAIPPYPQTLLAVGGLRALDRGGMGRFSKVIALEDDPVFVSFHQLLESKQHLSRLEMIQFLTGLSWPAERETQFKTGLQG